MKLINHSKKNYYEINTFVMHGTITMTSDEYAKAFMYLKGVYEKACRECETYTRDSLSSLRYYMGIGYISLEVVATKLIVKKYHLKGYKNQNYGIKIV